MGTPTDRGRFRSSDNGNRFVITRPVCSIQVATALGRFVGRACFRQSRILALPTGSPAIAEGVTTGTGGLRSGVLLHYDIRVSQDSLRRRVDRFLFGSKETRIVGGIRKTYRYPGLIDLSRGRHFGQSVVLLSPGAAMKAIALLEAVLVPYERLDILTEDWDVEVPAHEAAPGCD